MHCLCGALLCNCSSAEREGLSTHVQQECSAEPFMRSILCHKESSYISPVLTYNLVSPRCKFSTLTSTPLYSSRLYAQNPALKIIHQQSVKVYLHTYRGNVQQKQHPVSLRIFPSLPGSRLRFFIAPQIQYSYEHTFIQQ